MGKVMFMRKGDVHTKPSVGVPAGDLAVGSSIYLNENGVPAEYLVVNVGIPGDSTLYDASCDGVWLLRKDIYEKRQWHSSGDNKYAESTIHSYLNSDFLNLFDTNIQDQIKSVKIPYCEGNGSTTIYSGSSGLSTKVFLLSCCEVGYTQKSSDKIPIDSAKIDYFVDDNVSSSHSGRIAYMNDTATIWWTRTPYAPDPWNTRSVFSVSTNGACSSSYTPVNSAGVRPALILPYDMKIDESMIVGGAS